MSLYEEKESSYFGQIRTDLLRLIPDHANRVLDIGCGEGYTAKAVKTRTGAVVTGIELFPEAAEAARHNIDHVIMGDIESGEIDFETKSFDLIICADVLEHLKDPWAVLRRIHTWLTNDGTLVASIPNIQYLIPVLKIIFDKLEYEESGVLDRSHLRFFTKHTIKQMFSDTGFDILKITSKDNPGWKVKLLNILSFGLMHKFGIFQYLIIAKKNNSR